MLIFKFLSECVRSFVWVSVVYVQIVSPLDAQMLMLFYRRRYKKRFRGNLLYFGRMLRRYNYIDTALKTSTAEAGYGDNYEKSFKSWGLLCIYWIFFSPIAQQPLVGQGFLDIEASRSYSDTPCPVGLLWTSDQPFAGTSTWQHTIFNRQTSMPHVGFEPTFSADERSQTQVLNCAATGTGRPYFWDEVILPFF